MKKTYMTNRLSLSLLNENDADFILELFNTEGWIKFIGDRNIKTTEDSKIYIQKTAGNLDITYWVVKLKDKNVSIGLISFIKRNYLDHHDIGFALLPDFSNKGFAFEATEAVLHDALKDPTHKTMLATTMTDNRNSINLIEKLGFQFNKEIINEQVKLLLYSITID
jgi:ribosomal-protein-alanine N-acetyltransferase